MNIPVALGSHQEGRRGRVRSTASSTELVPEVPFVPLRRRARLPTYAPTSRPTRPADALKENVHMRESSYNVDRVEKMSIGVSRFHYRFRLLRAPACFPMRLA
jgi:hypothetical protein